MKSEDLYLKSGSIALTTDNSKDTYFDDYKIEPLECYVDPFDPESSKKYLPRTNRFREIFVADINQIWE